jgi:anti-sigma B factor antagonist
MDFEISTAMTEGSTSIISVTGELDLSTADQLAEAALVATSGTHRLVLDLSACTFIDSSGLRVVLRMHKDLAEDGKPTAIVVSDGHVRKLLSLTAIDQSIRVFPALGDAVAFLGSSDAEAATAASQPAPTAGRPSG